MQKFEENLKTWTYNLFFVLHESYVNKYFWNLFVKTLTKNKELELEYNIRLLSMFICMHIADHDNNFV